MTIQDFCARCGGTEASHATERHHSFVHANADLAVEKERGATLALLRGLVDCSGRKEPVTAWAERRVLMKVIAIIEKGEHV